jgi:tRNA A37 methylthiotransferase MiaB
MDEADFDAAYCFKFSPREGTEAARMDGAVPEAEKEARLAELLGRMEARAVAKASRMSGRTVEVLLEDGRQGRTEGYYRLRLDRPSGRPLVRAVVTGSQGALLTGREA